MMDESLACVSMLYSSLCLEAASKFYTTYHEDLGNAYCTHIMVYSSGILILILEDNGEWRSLAVVDVLTSTAVNAGEVRRGLGGRNSLEIQTEQIMYTFIS